MEDGIKSFLRELSAPFVGREEEARVITLTLLAREHSVLIGEPGCVAGDTIISDISGRLFYIDEIALNLRPGIYGVRVPLYPYGEATELHVYNTNRIIEIILEDGFSIKVTPNHPLMTDKGWITAANLSIGDRVLLYKSLPDKFYNKEFHNQDSDPSYRRSNIEKIAEIMGIILGCGSIKGNHLIFEVKENRQGFISYIEKLMREVFNVNYEEAIRIPEKDEVLIFFKLLSKGAKSILDTCRKCLARDRIPLSLLSSLKEFSSGFLRGLFDSEGKVIWDNTKGTLKIVLPFSRVETLRSIQILLLKHNILSKIAGISEAIQDLSADIKRERYHLIIEEVNSLQKYLDEIGFALPDNAYMFENYLKKMLSESRPSQISSRKKPLYKKVIYIRQIKGPIKVYDFHVPISHAFFTNGMLSHNTAKSALVRRAAELLNARFFKYLLTRFTEPAELFGPLDIKALEEGKYIRLTSGKLPEAEIAFLDEVFKANSAILNALNSILQERILYDGYAEVTVPLWSLFGASNEVPEEAEVEAVYDRFAARHFVRPISDDLWRELLKKSWNIERSYYFKGGLEGTKILDFQDLKKYHEKVLNVNLNPVLGKLVKLFAVLENRGLHVSDRRKGKLLKFVAANAVLEGRDAAEEKDLLVIKYVIPRDWEELEKVEAILSEELKTSYKFIHELREIKSNVREVMNYVISLRGIESKYIDQRFHVISRDLMMTRDRVISISKQSQDPEVKRLVNEVLELIDNTLEIIRKRLL